MSVWDEAVTKYQQMQTDYEAQIADFEKKVKQLNLTIETRDDKIKQLNNDVRLKNLQMEKMEDDLWFYEEYAVCVNKGSNKYHSQSCPDFDHSSFWIYNINAAEGKGYKPCPKCR